MKYCIDHDFHIHSRLSLCSNDPEQTPENILAYAKKNNLKKIVLTDHFWDDRLDCHGFGFYMGQNQAHIREALPLPSDPDVTFLFGCETDMDILGTVGITNEMFSELDFIIVPTTHLHFKGVPYFDVDEDTIENRAKLWVKRIETVINRGLPRGRTGLAHPTWGGMAPAHFEDHLQVLDLISTQTMRELCIGLRDAGIGIELNFEPKSYHGGDLDRVMRFFFVAKDCGCKFYFGSDSHHPSNFEGMADRFARTVEILSLTEEDKYHILPR